MKKILAVLLCLGQVGCASASNEGSPANVRTGNFEYDKPANWFEQTFGMPQAYIDGQGVTHYKPGGFLQAGRNLDYQEQAKSLQKLSGSENLNVNNGSK